MNGGRGGRKENNGKNKNKNNSKKIYIYKNII